VSELNLSAAAWLPEGPRIGVDPHNEGMMCHWKLRAEVSVSDSRGKPVGTLPQRAWSIHVTDFTGRTHAPSFGVTRANVSGQVIPGFYIVAVDDLPLTGFFLAPTALGLVIARKDSHGQLVVPIALAGQWIIRQLEPPVGSA
jgi:hypothetical protein